jgi:hypothetical protein
MAANRRRHSVRWLRTVAAGLLVVAAYPVFAVLQAGHGWRQSDWNQDGRTTVGEWFYGMDVGTRAVTVAGEPCIEYFAFKDGLPVRVDCPRHG